MKAESIVIGAAGTVFGLIVGWIIGTQQAPARQFAPPAAASAAQAPAGTPPAAAAVFDETQATALRNIAEKDPANVQSRVQLGNLYFDAERYQDAIQWYEAALKLNPNDVSVSTDLGVCFYYTNQPDRAVRQMEESLRIDPRHTKSLLNLGIVKAFGKQDLAGAEAAWQEVVRIAPDSPEGQAAKRSIANLQAAHPGGSPVPPPGTPAATQTPAPGGPGR
ncbi:MAG: tetratricopeptide repeat protein [Vicinamibacterales bacterium]